MIKSEEDRAAFYEGICHIPDHLLQEWTSRLLAGERSKQAEGWARAIIADFSLRASFNKPQSQFTLSWLAEAFDKILDFQDAREALALPKRPKHRPSGQRAEHAADVAVWVKLAMDRGYSEADANKLAADCFACDVRSVRRMRDASTGWVAGMNPNSDWTAYFKRRQRPLPPLLNQDGH